LNAPSLLSTAAIWQADVDARRAEIVALSRLRPLHGPYWTAVNALEAARAQVDELKGAYWAAVNECCDAVGALNAASAAFTTSEPEVVTLDLLAAE
jgi:hypothetical protein